MRVWLPPPGVLLGLRLITVFTDVNFPHYGFEDADSVLLRGKWYQQVFFDSTRTKNCFVDDVGPVGSCDNENHFAIFHSVELV